MYDELTREQLEQRLADTEHRLADVMADGGSYRVMQVKLDEQNQLHVDKDASHAAAIDALTQQHAQVVEGFKVIHAAETDKLTADHAAALAAQADDLAAKHAAEVQALKEKTLVPALRDLHARQAADLAAKQAAELGTV